MKGEYFKMKNHGLRRIFSLFLALFMVFTLLPTTALAEDTTGADETQPKTVVVNEGEKKTAPPPRRSSLRTRIPLHRKSRKHSPLHTLTVQTAQYFPIRSATCRLVPRPPLSAAPLPGTAIPSPAGIPPLRKP